MEPRARRGSLKPTVTATDQRSDTTESSGASRMTEDEADKRARELNVELGESGVEDAYYVVVQVRPDQWDVQRVEEPREPTSMRRALLESFFDHPPWL